MAFLDADGRPAHAAEHPRPLGDDIRIEVIYPDRVETFTPYPVGLVDLAEGEDARTVIQDLDIHPAASEHPDAPRIRLKTLTATWCPVTDAALIAHCAGRPRDALPPEAAAVLRDIWQKREDATPGLLGALGMSAEEIADLPKFRAKREAVQRAGLPSPEVAKNAIAERRIEARLAAARARAKPNQEQDP